jgi:hypothetical protein
MEITPEEYLYDPDRIFGGRDIRARDTRTDETIVRQPRVESTRVIEESSKVRTIAPVTEIPFIKKQTHLEPSRDSEFFFTFDCVELDPGEEHVLVTTMETMNNQRTIFRWIGMEQQDGLIPSGIEVTVRIDGDKVKYLAQPSLSGLQTVQTPTGIDISGIPFCFHNTLLEVIDRRTVTIDVTNTDQIATRRVCVGTWGWIESVTRFSEAVWH